MPSTNGHGPKRTILYARVSTDEQARSGYSLAQQLEALRGYAASEGYEVLEEVADPGQSGANLERPGMDHVRDLVAAGDVSVVLAQDRDRFSREPAYTYLLRREFEERGCSLRALNDRGDDSPEGDLTDGILDQLAKYERAKIAERTRRGKLRKAREGRVVVPTPKYGFRFNKARDALLIHEREMAVVEKILGMAAEGYGVGKIQSRLYAEGMPSPKGNAVWDRVMIKRIVGSDIYKPHTLQELAELLTPDVAASLDPDKHYGVQWFNRDKVTTRTVSEPDGNGGRRYRKKRASTRRPKEEWVAVPVPAYLSRELVDRARLIMADNKSNERVHPAREWELKGMLRCSCGATMVTKTSVPHGKYSYYHYRCARRNKLRKMCSCTEPAIRAPEVEEEIWEFICGLLKDPERIRAGVERLIEEEQLRAGRGDPEEEAKAWAEKVAECVRLRGAYQDQQAAGLMTIEELATKLEGLDEARRHAEREFATLKESRQRVEELERDRDALLESLAEKVPEELDRLSKSERNRIYRMLRLTVTPRPGGYEVSGVFCSTVPIG